MELPIAKHFRPPETDGERIDVWYLYDLLLRRWKIVAGTTGVVILFTLVVLYSITPGYTGVAQIMLDPHHNGMPGSNNLISELALDTPAIESQVTLLQSPSLLQRVVVDQKLVDDPEFGSEAKSFSLIHFLFGWLHSSSKSSSSGQMMDGAMPADVLSSVHKLQSALSVAREGTTYVLKVSVTSHSPEKAARLANAVANAYLVDQLDQRYDDAKRESKWLTSRLKSLGDQLRKAEEAVQKFRVEHNLVSTGTGTINQQQLSELNAKLVSVRAEAAERKAKYEQAEKIVKAGGNVDAIPAVIESNVIQNLREQEAQISRQEADLMAKYGPRHPLVVNVRAQHADIERQIGAEVKRIVANLQDSYEVVYKREMSLQNSLMELAGNTGIENQNEIQLHALERIAKADKTLYEQFLSRSKITQQVESFKQENARVIAPASVPGAPSYPRKKIILAFALVFGLGLGFGSSYLLDFLNPGFRTYKQIEDQLGLPVLSSISLLDEEEIPVHRDVRVPAYLCISKPLSRYSEAIRSLRTGIEMADVDQPPRVVLVTSAVPGEGKSTLAASIAFSAVRVGRVLLMDCDLRRPGSLSKGFGIAKRPGVVDLLTRSASLQQVIHHDQASGIHVIGAGSSLPQNPPDLLGSVRMAELIVALRESYNLVIVDVPPVAPVVDAKVMSRLVDKVAFVVKWAETRRELVAQCVAQVNADRKVAGIALNFLDERQTSRYGRYAYYGPSYYGQYYTE